MELNTRMFQDEWYDYSIASTTNEYVVDAVDFTSSAPYSFKAYQNNGLISPVSLSYAGSDDTQLELNPNLYIHSGTKSVSNNYYTLTYNYNSNTYTITKQGGSYNEVYILEFGTGQLCLLAHRRSSSESSYPTPPSVIQVRDGSELIDYNVTSVSYTDCDDLIISPTLPKHITFLRSAFFSCTYLTTAPVIPSGVTDMDSCFFGCSSLTGDIYIYSQQLDSYSNCFYGTTLPITLHAMNNNVDICEQLASTADNNNVYINTAPTALPSTVECAPMNYQTDNGLVQLSPQTDASLVSVQVPYGSGTTTTTLEDALMDLYSRISPSTLYTTSLNSEVTSNGLTFTPIGNGEIRVNGTSTSTVRIELMDEPIIKGARYKLTGCPNMGSCIVRQSFFSYNNGFVGTYGYMLNNMEYSLSSGSLSITSDITSGQTFNNVIIKPELRLVGDE